jgi:hypothetical protein
MMSVEGETGMPSKTIQPRRRGANKEKLNPMQRIFVEELLADEGFNATKAARKAGYKQPQAQSAKLLAIRSIRDILGKALSERITRCQLTADAVLEHLRVALFMDPLDLFERTKGGAYLIKSLEDVPEEVRRCITKLKCRSTTIGKKTVTYLEVELMSKDAALPLAMKHLGIAGVENIEVDVEVKSNVFMELLKKVEQDRNVIDTKYIEDATKDQ